MATNTDNILFAAESPVLLVGAGNVDASMVNRAKAFTQKVVAIDGGANHCRRLGLQPELILGDFDSIEDPARWHDIARLEHMPDQQSTDFEKALMSILAPLLIGVGFLAPGVDHMLAALHGMLRFVPRPVVLIGAEDIVFAAPPCWRCRLPARTRFSIWPLKPVKGLQSSGLRWPIEALDFQAGVQIGTSNITTEAEVSLRFDDWGALIILPHGALEAVVLSLTLPPEG